MDKKNIYILIFAIVFFIGSLIFFLSTLSNDTNSVNNNTDNYLDNTLIEETCPPTPDDTTSLDDTTDVSDTSDSTQDNSSNNILVDFTYYNEENKESKISNFKNKPMAILFTDFSENYETSVEHLSLLNSFYEKYNFKVQFLCIDKTTSATADSNIKIYKDKDGIENYLIETLPTLVFIDKDGEIVDQNNSVTFEDIELNLELITETENV